MVSNSVHFKSILSTFLPLALCYHSPGSGFIHLLLVSPALVSSLQVNLHVIANITLLKFRSIHVIFPQTPVMTALAYTIESKLVNVIEDP